MSVILRRGRLAWLLTGMTLLLMTLVSSSPAHADDTCEPGVTKLIAQKPVAHQQLGIDEAKKLARGYDVTVAVVDSGVSANNIHLQDAVIPGVDLLGASSDGRVDESGHGTAIAALIAARPVEGSGVVGIAPEAKILPIRTYISDSPEMQREGRGPSIARTIEGIRIAAQRKAQVIVVPQSSTTDVPELRQAVHYANSLGSLVIASAGNVTDKEPAELVRFPAGYPEALSVTAVDANGLPSPAVSNGVHVDLAAPGASVQTAFLQWGDCIFAAEHPSTSYAVGYAAGAAALLVDVYPNESPEEWKYRLMATALRPSLESRDPNLGWGLLAPYNAINFINDGSMPGPDNPLFRSEKHNIAAPLAQPTHSSADTSAPLLWVVGISTGVLVLGVSVLLISLLRSRGISSQ